MRKRKEELCLQQWWWRRWVVNENQNQNQNQTQNPNHHKPNPKSNPQPPQIRTHSHKSKYIQITYNSLFSTILYFLQHICLLFFFLAFFPTQNEKGKESCGEQIGSFRFRNQPTINNFEVIKAWNFKNPFQYIVNPQWRFRNDKNSDQHLIEFGDMHIIYII